MKQFKISEQPYVFREFLTYMMTIKGKSPNTIKEYASDLNIFFKFMVMHFKLDSSEFDEIKIDNLDYSIVKKIQLTDIYEYLSFMNSERNNSAATRARKVACIRSHFKYMTNKAKYLEDNPAKDLDSPKIKQALPRYLELDECKRLLSSIDGPYKDRDYAIITLFLKCGMRLSELVNINLSDVKDDYITVTGKGNKERVIYLNSACISAIKKYMKTRPVDNVKDRNALFLSSRLQRISPKTVQHLVKMHIENAGLDPVKFSVHKLRHTAATIMYKYGQTDLRTLQEILGHEQLATTQIYTHINDENKREAAKNNPLANI